MYFVFIKRQSDMPYLLAQKYPYSCVASTCLSLWLHLQPYFMVC